MRFERREGWERRLADALAEAARHPYALGTHDCFRVACSAVCAVTGVDLWPEWAGRYATQREAVALIAEYGGHGDGNAFTRAFSRLFGTEPVSMKLAHRGDIAEFIDDVGQQHLGVILNSSVAVWGETIAYMPRKACVHAWRIG